MLMLFGIIFSRPDSLQATTVKVRRVCTISITVGILGACSHVVL